MKINCALSESQIEKLYAHAYGTIYKLVSESKDARPVFNSRAYMHDLFEKIANKQDVATAAKFIQFLPVIIRQASLKFRALKIEDSVELDDYAYNFTDAKEGLNNIIKEFRPQESANTKKATIEQKEKEAGNIILTDPEDDVVPEAVFLPFSALTSTFIEWETMNPDDKNLFTQEEVNNSKKRIYNTLEKIKEQNSDEKTAYDGITYQGRTLKLLAKKLTDVEMDQFDSYTQRLISRSSYFQDTGKGQEGVTEASETVILILSDGDNELYFNEDGEITTKENGKIVYQFARDARKQGNRYIVTNRYGYQNMQTPALIAQKLNITEEQADEMQQKEFKKLYEFKETALKNPVVIDLTGVSPGISLEWSTVNLSFKQLKDSIYGTPQTFSSIGVAKTTANGISKGWGTIEINGEEYGIDRPNMKADLINKIAAVMTNPKISVAERADFVNQFLTNELPESVRRHYLVYDRAKKEFTFKYNLYTANERAVDGLSQNAEPIELYDISKVSKEKLDEYRDIITKVLLKSSTDKTNTQSYSIKFIFNETATANNLYRDYNIETGEFVDEQQYLDLIFEHNPIIKFTRAKRPSYVNSYMQFRLPSTFTQQVKEAKKQTQQAAAMSAIRRYKNTVVGQILNQDNQILEITPSYVNIENPSEVTGRNAARNFRFTNPLDGNSAKVFVEDEVVANPELRPKAGDVIYLTVESIDESGEDQTVVARNVDGVKIGTLQETDFAGGEEQIKYSVRQENKEQKAKADQQQGIDPTDTSSPETDSLGFVWDRKAALPNNVTKEDIERAEKWIKDHPMFVGKNKISAPQLVNIVNSDAYARFIVSGKNLIDAKILVNAAKGGNMVDAYHEAWHAFSQLYLTKAQKKALYNELRDSKPEYKDMSFLELEEILAEDFRSYALKESVKKDQPVRNSLFRRILNWLKKLFERPTTVETMFRDLYFANNNPKLLNKYTPLIENVMFDMLNRGAGQVGNNKKEALSRRDSDIFIESMDSIASELVDKSYSDREQLIATQSTSNLESKGGVVSILEDKRNRPTLYTHIKNIMTEKLKSYRTQLGQITDVSFDTLTTEELLEKNAYALIKTKDGATKYVFLTPQVESFKNLSLDTKDGSRLKGETYDGVDIVSDFYAHKTLKDSNGEPLEVIVASTPEEVVLQFNNFQQVDDNYDKLIQRETPNLIELSDEQMTLLNQIRILQAGLSNWGDSGSGMIKYHNQNSKYDIIRDTKEDIEDTTDDEDLEKNSARTGYNKDTGKESLEEMASKETLYILSSLHKVDLKGNHEYDMLGFKKLAPFREVWNNAARTIGGTKSPQEQYEKLVEAAKTFPEFRQLVDYKLPDPSNPKGRKENAITTAFFQDFGRKTKLDIQQLTVFENGEAQVVEADMDVRRVTRQFIGDFTTDLNNDYIDRSRNISSLKINKVVDDFKDKTTGEFDAKKSLEFARAIGIYLDQNETIRQELTKDQKTIEYYGLPYIYDILKKLAVKELTKGLTNDVKNYIADFKKAPVKFLMTGIPEGIISEKAITEKTQIERLATLQARYGSDFSNFSSVNAEGNTVYRFINDHSIALVVDGINRATKLSDFWTTDELMYMSFMNPAINSFTKRLRTIKTLFENNAENTKRNGKSISLVMNSGTQKLSGTNKSGSNTTSLDYYGKFLQEMHTMLKGGLQEFIRTAAKSSSFGARIEGGIIDPTGAKKNDARLWIDLDRFANGTAENYAFQYHFLEYIAGEYDRIVTFNSNKEEFKKYIGYNRVVGKDKNGNDIYAGGTFMAFDKVLESTTKDLIFEKVGNQKLDDYLKTDPELRQKIFDDVVNYFNEQTKKNLGTLQKAKYISNDLYKRLEVFGLDNDQIEEALVKAYTYNSWIQHFETVVMFFGDPAQVNHKKEEQHKRNTGATSNGPGFRTDVGARKYINDIASKQSYAATLAEKNPGKGYNEWYFNGRFNTAIMQDVVRTSVYIDIINEALRKNHLERLSNVTDKQSMLNILKPENKKELGDNPSIEATREALAKQLANNESSKYSNMEEGDGQGYVTFDAYKYLKELENDWSDAQDKIYKQIVDGKEVSAEDMVRLFPPYKIQYYGHLHGTKLPVTAMHKFEVTPLIPPMIQGSDLQSLHEQMLRNNIQYATFQTGSKLGSITSQVNDKGEAVADKIYLDKDNKVFNKDIKFTKNIIYLEYLKKVTNMPSEFKEQTIFSTQMRAIVLDGLFNQGKVIRPEYQELADNYISAVNNYSELLREELEEEIGYEKTDEGTKIDLTSFMKLVQKELRRKDIPEHLINFIGVNPDNTLKFDLSFHPNADDIEKMITTLVEKRLIKQKVNGEALIQIASSMTKGLWDAELKRATKEEVLKFMGTNTLPFYHPGPDGKTRAQKVAIALHGDFVNLLNGEYKGEKIATIARLNQAIKDDEWLDANNGRNRKAITLTGVRIPVDSLSQMDFMEVYQFLDPSASNIIIMPTEMVAKSGGDYDGDKLTTSFPHISKKGNFILQKRSNEELMQEVAELKSKKKNSEAKILIDLQKKVLQNELITSVRAILETPGNYANLVRPNTVDRLQEISKELKKYVAKFNVYERAHGEADGSSMSPTNIFEIGYNNHKFSANLDSARPLGITAVENKLGPIFNSIGGKMPDTYVVDLKDKDTGPYTETRNMRLFLPHNTIKENGKEYISLSDINSSDYLDIISVVNSQKLNGFLDVEKDEWVAYIQGNLEIAPILIYLFKAGVPVEDAIYFVSNPMVREYAEQKRLIQSKYAELIGTHVKERSFADYNAGVRTLINFGILPNVQNSYFNNDITNKTNYPAIDRETKKEGILDNGVFDRAKMLDVIKNPNQKNEDLMYAMFLHFIEIEKQIKGVSALKRQLNPDTSRNKTVQESIRRDIAFEDLKDNSKVDQETKRRAREKSILSSFFQTELIREIIEPVFPFRNNSTINNFLFNYIQYNKERITKNFGEGRDGVSKFITAYKNAVATSLYQNNIGSLYDPEGDLITYESMTGSDENSFNNKFLVMLKELPESLKYQYSILTQIRPENIGDKRVITLNNRRSVKGDLASTYYQELKALSNPNVKKVSDSIMNQYISQMFDLFTKVAVYQSGLGYSDTGFIQAIPFNEIATIMQKNSKEYAQKLDSKELNRIADILLSGSRKFKNYGPETTGGAPVTVAPEPVEPIEPEESYDTSTISEEDIESGKVVTRKVIGKKLTPEEAPSSKNEINIYSTDKNGFENLSNILNGPVKATVNGKELTFKTVEHLYQVKKALFAGDRDTANKILNSATGWDAQKLGSPKGPIQWTKATPQDWDKVSTQELESAMRLAFEQNQAAKDLLLRTGDALLTHKTGFNLGKWETVFPEILMKIRSELKTVQPVASTTNNPAEYTNHSGGAYGGDTFWDVVGREFGVTKHMHYREEGNQSLSQKLRNAGVKAAVLTKEQMNFARAEVKRVLGKEYPDTLEGNLKVRNYYQVANSDSVFAIADLKWDYRSAAEKTAGADASLAKSVKGGTDVAVQLGIALNKPTYVWDIVTKKWHQWDPSKQEFIEITTPKLTKNFAGVGSRDIEDYPIPLEKDSNGKVTKWGKTSDTGKYKGKAVEEAAKQAIRDVYTNTFKAPATQPSTSVKPIVKDLSRWADIKDATTPYTDKGIVVTRVGNTEEQFGNPFIGSKRRDKQGNLIESKVDNITVFNTIDEADQAYRDWLMGAKHQNIKPARREWILKQINEGKLDGKTLLYYKPMEVTNNDGTIVKGGYHSHADTLAEIVEELRGTQPSTQPTEVKQGVQDLKFTSIEIPGPLSDFMVSFIDQKGNKREVYVAKDAQGTPYIKLNKPPRDSKGNAPNRATVDALARKYLTDDFVNFMLDWKALPKEDQSIIEGHILGLPFRGTLDSEFYNPVTIEEINKQYQDKISSKIKKGVDKYLKPFVEETIRERIQKEKDSLSRLKNEKSKEKTRIIIEDYQKALSKFENKSTQRTEVIEDYGIDFSPSMLTEKPIGTPLDQSEGIGICDGTCGLMANRLKEAGMPYGSANIADKYANYHAIALTDINGERYILNQPQHEFLGREYQKAPLWERALYWRNMDERFNRHFPKIFNDIVFAMGENIFPGFFDTVEIDEYGLSFGPLFKDKKEVIKGNNKVLTATLIEDPTVKIKITFPADEELEDQVIDEVDFKSTKDGEILPVWKATEFYPRLIKATKENLSKEYQLDEEQVEYSMKQINEAVLQPGTKVITQKPAPIVEAKPVSKETTITYTPKGKEKQTYTIRGNKIFNKAGEEVFKEASVDRTKIFANLAIKEGRAMVVEHKGDKYVVNNKDQIVSVKTGRLMQWRENNGDRQAIITMAAAMRDQQAVKSLQTPVKLIDDADVEAFNTMLEANKNMKPKEYVIGDSKYMLNSEGYYDLVDKTTGEAYIKNIDLTTGYTEIVPDQPVNESQRKQFIKSIKDGIKNYELDEQLAYEGIDVNEILAKLEAATTQAEMIENISKILKKIC